jgi:hypothetical protein
VSKGSVLTPFDGKLAESAACACVKERSQIFSSSQVMWHMPVIPAT